MAGFPVPCRAPAPLQISSRPFPKHHSNAEGEDGEGGRRAHAVDVVVNPWVVREAMKHRAFQAQVVALALEWVGEEAGLTLSAEAPCAVLSPALCPYWDGSVQGAKGVTPRPFVLDEVGCLLGRGVRGSCRSTFAPGLIP